MIKVKDIMEENVYTCHENVNVKEVMEYLYEKGIGGVPLVDGDLKVVGFISDGDIMKYVSKHKPIIFDYCEISVTVIDNTSFEDKVQDLMEMKAAEIATKDVVCMDSEDSVDEAAQALSVQKIKKVPVVSNGTLVGVVSRSMIIRHIMQNMITVYDEIAD